MTYGLIIISFVAMGGPHANTPTLDHIPGFANSELCLSAGQRIHDLLVMQQKDIITRFTCERQS